MPLDGELQVVGITAALNTAVTPASQQSGSTWQYLISLSCGAVVGSPCDDLVVTIPIPAVPTATGAWTSWATPTVTGDATLISGGASAVAVSGGNWVITLGRSLDPGEAPVLTLSVTVPNYTTPNNFQWQLRPSVSGSNVATVTVPAATAVATSTAVGACVATPASATAATQVLGPIAATRNFWAVWYFTTNAAATGQLSPTPGSTMTGTVSYTAYLSYAGSDASAPTSTPSGVIGTDNPAGRVLTYQVAIGSSTPIVGSTIWAQPQFTLNTVGTFTVTFGGSYLPVGAASPINCSLGQSYQITNNVISGQIFIKNSQGYTATGPTSAMGTAGTAGGNFAMAPKEDRPTNGMDFWSIYLYRNNATLQAMHLFDGMPCLTSGTGLTTAAAYQSLAEPAVCAQPAFHMTVVVLSGDALDGQQVTFVYSDGTSAVIPMTTTGTVTGPGSTRVLCTASSPCLIPDPGKMVASVVVDGSYNVDDASSYKAILLYGWPVASLPSTSSRYLRNVATLTSRASPAQFATTAVSVGMYTPADSVLLVGQTTSTAYTYSGSWSGSTTNSPCNYAVCNSANYNAGVWAYSSDPSLDAQRRTAVVFPAGSGVTLTAAGVQPYTTYGTPAVYGPAVSPVVGNYGGFGAGTTLYSFDASSVNGVAVPNGAGVGVRVSYGGMAPGVYVYYTYTGLTDTNPTDSGATCTATNASVVSDATGIIGPVGVTRQLCRSTNTIIVQSPSAGINVSKMVRDVTAGTDYVASPGVLDALPGDQVQFRIRISNTGPAALSNVYVYDILPYIGDTGIMGSLVGQARGTTNNINLASLPTAPTGWTLTYNTSTNPCRPEVWIPPAASGTATPTGCANTWSTAGNVTTARAVRMFIASLPVATVSVPYYDLLLTYTVPPAASWVLGNVEWNTVAVGGTYGSLTLSPTESPKVGFRFPPSALVWRKIDSSTRDPLAGASFRVTGPGGYTQDVTDNDSVDADPTAGGFKLTGLAAGTYAITETAAPAGFALNTTTYHVTIGAPGLTGDGGDIPDDLLPKTVTVYLAKLGQDSGGAWVALSGSDWQVLADDHGSAGAPDASVSVTGTGEPGMFEISGLTAGAWWLTETRAPAGYALLAAPVQFTVSATGVVALGAGASANITAAAGSPAQAPWWVITVRDVRAMALPPAGGAGQRGAWAAGGGLLSASLVLGVVLAVADRRRLARR
ncbi:MAG: SpaA isopeptide-forming pilin-related protein [Actinomycetia bacterium]|nr:SpaA isopeptide-forming pilin-related protein [Actinomycetes bacterium]